MYRKHLAFGVNIFIVGVIILLTVGCNVQNDNSTVITDKITPTLSAYRELLDTEIRGIDPATIEDYLNGKGLGLALPAELNGYPGPRHVLDLADELELSQEQTRQTQALFNEMQPQAIELGKQILAEEAKLEQAFRDKIITEDFLQGQLTRISELQAQLRYVHLRTHLTTVDILSEHQIGLYNTLRGYGEMPSNNHQHSQQHN
jgi:hypothetical protein